jgi:pilus assembly protein CpaE
MGGNGSVALRARGNRFKIIVTGGSESQREELRHALAALTDLNLEVIDLAGPPRMGASNEHEMMHVLLFIPGDDPELWSEELRPWIARGGWALVAAVLTTNGSATMRQALRAGANEVLCFPIDPVDLARLLVKVSETYHSFHESTGKVAYSLVGVAGGTGVSTLSVLLGLALQELTRKKVGLIDLGLQSGALSTLLDLEPQHTISELIDPTSAVDSIRLEPVICKHPSGLHLLSAPRAIEEGEMVSAATVESAMTVMTQLFDYVVVDCGHHITEGLVAAWERSDTLLYVLDQSVVSVHCAQRFLDLFGRLKLSHVSLGLLVNRFRHGHPITVEKIESALNRPIALRIPRDEAAMTAVEEAQGGLAAMSSRTPIMAAAQQLARMLLGGQYSVNGNRQRSMLSRLFGAASH